MAAQHLRRIPVGTQKSTDPYIPILKQWANMVWEGSPSQPAANRLWFFYLGTPRGPCCCMFPTEAVSIPIGNCEAVRIPWTSAKPKTKQMLLWIFFSKPTRLQGRLGLILPSPSLSLYLNPCATQLRGW